MHFNLTLNIFIMHLKTPKYIFLFALFLENVYLIYKIKNIIFACIFNSIAILSFKSLLIAILSFKSLSIAIFLIQKLSFLLTFSSYSIPSYFPIFLIFS